MCPQRGSVLPTPRPSKNRPPDPVRPAPPSFTSRTCQAHVQLCACQPHVSTYQAHVQLWPLQFPHLPSHDLAMHSVLVRHMSNYVLVRHSSTLAAVRPGFIWQANVLARHMSVRARHKSTPTPRTLPKPPRHTPACRRPCCLPFNPRLRSPRETHLRHGEERENNEERENAF